MYQLTHSNHVCRLADHKMIPFGLASDDLTAYQAWLAAGHTPTPAAPLPTPTKDAQITALLVAKGVTRLLVQLTIEVAEDKARALAPSYGMTEAQALTYAYGKNKSYRECKDLEAALRAVETAP